MISRLKPSHALQHLIMNGVRIGIEGRLFTHDNHLVSDDEIIQKLGKLGFEISNPARFVVLVRESARVKSDRDSLRWKCLDLKGAIDDTCPSPLRFIRKLDSLSVDEKLAQIDWFDEYLAESVKNLDGTCSQLTETLRISQIYRKHWRRFLKEKQK